MTVGERSASKKLRVKETVLGTRELSAKGGTLRGSVKLPSRDVYQGFLDHEAEGLGEERKKGKTKAEEDPKKRYLAFLTFSQQTPRGLRVSFK